MRTLALIPARAGSRGIPHKNTRKFKGLPLLAHAIRVGLATCDRTVVSTEDMETACLAAAHGAHVLMRPDELAQDETPMLPVVQHALANAPEPPDVVVLLQPSSPSLRRVEHVWAALAHPMLQERRLTSIASVVEIPGRYNPDRALWRSSSGDLIRYDDPCGDGVLDGFPTRRQDSEPCYYFDGTVYVIKRGTLEAGKMFGFPCYPLIIPASESVTIDIEEDWVHAEALHG